MLGVAELRERLCDVLIESRSRDCDGPHASYSSEVGTVTFTRSPKKTGTVLVSTISYRVVKRRQRDVFAEAAGY
jgi:hypothetical protein